ncbi:Uncharacterised protein [Mycobacterium tuberculosis]|nr:Uncharacterised protein [Mycobacterium tuberculosis]
MENSIDVTMDTRSWAGDSTLVISGVTPSSWALIVTPISWRLAAVSPIESGRVVTKDTRASPSTDVV